MRILAIETSCDETSAAVVEKTSGQSVKVLSNITATSLAIHATTGGIIPENAAREQVKFIIPVITRALLESEGIELSTPDENFKKSNEILRNKIDTLAITYGPGLIGSLLVGVETIKTLSLAFDKPIIPVNHLLAHLFANFIDNKEHFDFPFIGLIVSGGHTDLLLFKSLKEYEWLGGTRDDAAGEALDKIGRLLNLAYPAGPEIEKRAALVKNPTVKFQSPMIGSSDLDFSFSGLKAEASRFIPGKTLTEDLINEICYAVQHAIFKVLVKKTLTAAAKHSVKTVLLGGGVSANQTLLKRLKENPGEIKVISPEPKYSTDNGAMIGAYAAINPNEKLWSKIESKPDLYFA